MLSQKARYAIRAMLMLAERTDGEPLLIGDIAQRQSVPKKFLELILLDLKKRGLVHSRRGKHGGYVLGKAPRDITFAEVIRVMDGPLAQVPCASRTAYRRCEDCEDEQTCAIRRSLIEVRDATAQILEKTTLARALSESRLRRKG
jgi:Rrf2 family protein